jgi:hypothetical protein
MSRPPLELGTLKVLLLVVLLLVVLLLVVLLLVVAGFSPPTLPKTAAQLV